MIEAGADDRRWPFALPARWFPLQSFRPSWPGVTRPPNRTWRVTQGSGWIRGSSPRMTERGDVTGGRHPAHV